VALTALGAAAQPAKSAPLVTSDSDCPSAADVMSRLAGLVSGDNPTSVVARIRVQLGQIAVQLAGESDIAATRVLPAEPDCGSRAQSAALVIAAWLDAMPADSLVLAEPVAASAPATAPATAPVTAPVPAPALAPTSLSAQSRFSLGLGAYASVDVRGAGAALSGETAWARVVGRFGLAATLCSPLPRDTTVAGGTALWWRPVLALVLRAPLTQGTWIVDAGVGPVFGLLLVSGSGFRPNHTDVAVSWGALAGLRLAHGRGHAGAYWAELRTLLWPAAQTIRVTGANPSSAALPRIEGQLGLGFSFGAF
jgi:hypothetical protein